LRFARKINILSINFCVQTLTHGFYLIFSEILLADDPKRTEYCILYIEKCLSFPFFDVIGCKAAAGILSRRVTMMTEAGKDTDSAMGEDKRTAIGWGAASPKKSGRNSSMQLVLSCAALQALLYCAIPAKSWALPQFLPSATQPESNLTPVQDNGAKLTARNVSTPGSEPVKLDLAVNLGEISGYAFLMFRGVPEEFNFTNGFRVKNSWVVSLRDLDALQLVPPAGYAGQLQLTVLLVRGRNETVESHTITVSFGAREVAPLADNPPQNENELLTSAIPTPSPDEGREAKKSGIGLPDLGLQIPSELQVSREEEQKLLERAAKLVEIGEIASARLMFEHLARQGSGLGALALAQTFDPIYFSAMKTLGGPTADVEKARMWYHIAAELGQTEADTRLGALSDK
jgi:hypothetical protein